MSEDSPVARYAVEHALETYRSMIQISLFALKFAQVINGGAIVALLAYRADVSQSTGIEDSLWWFAVGLVLGGLASMLAWAAQFQLLNERVRGKRECHMYWVLFAAVVLLGSFACFGRGAYVVAHALAL